MEKKTFELGRCYVTRGAGLALQEAGQSPDEFLDRLMLYDFGTIDAMDWEENLSAIQNGGRVLAAYTTRKGEKLWIVTEADRQTTVVLLPIEY